MYITKGYCRGQHAERIYRQKPKSFKAAKQLIDEYIDFYNNERIQAKTRLTPLEKRRQAA